MKKLLVGIAVLTLSVVYVTPASAQIGFGRAVAAGEDEAFVGEPGNQATPGFVYVYRPDSGAWSETAILSADDAFDADGFGSGVAVDGARMAIGAENANAVYVFERVDGLWSQIAKIEVGSVAGDLFGASVA